MKQDFAIVCAVVIGAVVLLLLAAWPFMWVWNYAIVAAVSTTNPIEYWVAFWLMLFISLFIAGANLSSPSGSK